METWTTWIEDIWAYAQLHPAVSVFVFPMYASGFIYLGNAFVNFLAAPVQNIITGPLELIWPIEMLQAYHGRTFSSLSPE